MKKLLFVACMFIAGCGGHLTMQYRSEGPDAVGVYKKEGLLWVKIGVIKEPGASAALEYVKERNR